MQDGSIDAIDLPSLKIARFELPSMRLKIKRGVLFSLFQETLKSYSQIVN